MFKINVLFCNHFNGQFNMHLLVEVHHRLVIADGFDMLLVHHDFLRSIVMLWSFCSASAIMPLVMEP